MTNYYVNPEIVKQIISSHNKKTSIDSSNLPSSVLNKQINKENKKIMTNEKTTMEESNVWVSRTKSGKGFIIALDEGAAPGTVYVGSIANLKKMVEGTHKGVKLSKFVKE